MSFETYTIESKIHSTWTEFKKYLDGTYATLAFTFDEKTDFYTIVTEPYAGVVQRYELLKDAGADQTDFDTNYKTLPLRASGSLSSNAVHGVDADGTAPTKAPVLIAGYDGTNVQSIRTANDGTIRVDPTGTTTQPVSGTVTANAGTGNFNTNLSQYNGASVGAGNALHVQPGTGAVFDIEGTGVAGTPAGGVLSIQGVSGGTPVPVSGSITATNPSVGTNNSAIPTSSTQVGGSDGTNLQAARVFDLDSGAGSQFVLGVGLRKAASGGSVELGTSTDPIRIDPTGTTTQPVYGTVTANAGTGNFTVVQSTASNLRSQTASESTTGAAVPSVASLIGASDGTNIQSLRSSTTTPAGTEQGLIVRNIPSGTQAVSGTVTANAGTGNFSTNLAQYNGVAVGAGNAIHIQSGTGATFAVTQATASSLNAQVVGNVASGNAVSGNPVRIGGSDGANVRDILTDTSGRIVAVGAGVAGTPAGGVLSIQGVSGGTPMPISGTVTASNPSVGTNNSAIPTSSTQLGGSDGTNLQAARVYDVNSGAGSEYVLGMTLRKTTSTGSVEFGTDVNPLNVSFPKYQRSAFEELRVAQNFTLADLVNKYEIDTREYSTSTATGGTVTHIPNQSAIRLTVTGTSGSESNLRTNTFYRYQAGKGLRIKQTVYHADTGQTNQTRRWGFFDANDGLFWQLSGTSFGIVRRTSTSGSPVDTSTLASSFSVDPLNGTGPSGITLDLTKGNIFEINFQWLGVGTVNFYVNGYLVHQIFNANTLAAPYMKTAQLPLSFQVINTGASTTSSMTNICNSVIAEGGEYPPEYSFCAFNSAFISVTTTERPVLSIRPKSTYNSITNRMLILPKLLSIATEGARIGFRLVYNGTLTGASFNSVSTYSGVEFDVASTSLTGGETLYYGFLPNANDAASILIDKLFEKIARVLRQNAFATGVDSLTVMAVNEQSGTTSVKAALVWGEIR